MGKYGRNGLINGRRNDYIAKPASGRVNKAALGVGAGNDQKKVLAQFDARLKLLEKQDALQVAKSFGLGNKGRFIRDARELLDRKEKNAKKAEMRKEIAAYKRLANAMDDEADELEEEEEEEEEIGGYGNGAGLKRPQNGAKSASEPVVIVTGLGNIRKKGDKIEVVKKRNSQHQVLSNGVSTLVTVDNDLARQSRSKTNGKSRRDNTDDDEDGGGDADEEYLNGRPSSNLKNLAPLKIRVENDLARRNSDRSSSPPYQRDTQTYYNSNHHHHHHHQPLPHLHYEPASYARAPPPSSRPPPSSAIVYPPSSSSSNEHLNGRLNYNGYPPASHGGHYGHHEGRPMRRPSPPPPEYRYQPPAPPPQSYHTSHDHHGEGMDYEDSYHTNEPVRQAPPPPPPVVKSSLSSSRGRSNQINENGYRVVVSNLHLKVTQEDILVRALKQRPFADFLGRVLTIQLPIPGAIQRHRSNKAGQVHRERNRRGHLRQPGRRLLGH